MRVILFFLFLFPQFVSSQQTNHLQIFDNLINKNWKADGKWGDGTVFKQEIRFEYGLDENIIITRSKGFTDQEQKIFGNRNYGIRKYDPTLNKIQFWEFDVFGGTTKGKVIPMDKSILYQYEYGDSFISEIWEYVNDWTYNFKVGDYKDGKWNQIYLTTQFIATPTSDIEEFYAQMKTNLIGEWSAKAWDGMLNEIWFIDEKGFLNQKATYIENEKIAYEAVNKIELIDNEIILITVIKDNNPKIFKAASYTKDEIVFTNSDYKNPNRVVYNFLSGQEFQRTISGIENGQSTSYTFEFKKN